MVADFVDHLLGGGAADIGLRAGAKTFGYRHAHLDDAFGPRLGQSLGIRVGDDEVDALEAGIDHVVDGVTARAADAENDNPRLQFADVGNLQIDAHGLSLQCAGGIDRRVSPAAPRPLVRDAPPVSTVILSPTNTLP